MNTKLRLSGRFPSLVLISIGLISATSLITLIISLYGPSQIQTEPCKQIKGRDTGTCLFRNAVYKSGDLEWDPKAIKARRLWLHAKGYLPMQIPTHYGTIVINPNATIQENVTRRAVPENSTSTTYDLVVVWERGHLNLCELRGHH